MEWISVKDKLPEEDEEVLTYDGYSIQTAHIAWFENDVPFFMNRGSPSFNATHWMPLPSHPGWGEIEATLAFEPKIKSDKTVMSKEELKEWFPEK